MSSKTKSEKVPVLKGQEAEDKVLEYIKRMNRPFGAVDVAANLKGAVPKATTQKIMVTLADKGELVQKMYGKTAFFVANQANLLAMSADEVAAIEQETKDIEEKNKTLQCDTKLLSTELTKLKNAPTDEELADQIRESEQAVDRSLKALMPLRSGTPLISSDDIALLDVEWEKWRAQWVRRKRIFDSFWSLATDALPPQESSALAEDLGVEYDTNEHAILDRKTVELERKAGAKRRRF